MTIVYVVTGKNLNTGKSNVAVFDNVPTKRKLHQLAYEWGDNPDMEGRGYLGSDTEINCIPCVVNESGKREILNVSVFEKSMSVLPNASGLLSIVNTANGKRFVIATRDVRYTAEELSKELRSIIFDIEDSAISKHLWHSFRKYGEDVFQFSCTLTSYPYAVRLEEQEIENYNLNSSNYGYNHN